MALRDDLIAIVDDVRSDIVDGCFGLRLDAVVVRTRTWDGGETGAGNKTDVDLTLEPVPRVREPDPRLRISAAGVYQDGDRIVDRISATYTEAQLTGRPRASGVELFWLVDDEPYSLVRIDERYLGWRVLLRRMSGRP